MAPNPRCTKDGVNSTSIGIPCYCPGIDQDCSQYFNLIIEFIVHITFLKGWLLPENEITCKDLCCLYLSSGHPIDFTRFTPRAHETQKGNRVYQIVTPYLMYFTAILTCNSPTRTNVSFLSTALTKKEIAHVRPVCVQVHRKKPK